MNRSCILRKFILHILTYGIIANSASALPEHNKAPILAAHHFLPRATYNVSEELQVPSSRVRCFGPDLYDTYVNYEICRPVLNVLISFLDARLPRRFIYHHEPRVPQPPPFHFWQDNGECGITVSTWNKRAAEEFSMEYLRRIATNILTQCWEQGRFYGGLQQVVSPNAWWISVHGPAPRAAIPTIGSPWKNATTPQGLNPSSIDELSVPTEILCHKQQTRPHHATVDLCRQTLADIRAYPAFSRIQPFEAFVSPRVEKAGKISYPPFNFYIPGARCLIELKPSAPLQSDHFSFSEIKGLATRILENCEGEGNHGGRATIGRKRVWYVDVLGTDPLPGDGATMDVA